MAGRRKLWNIEVQGRPELSGGVSDVDLVYHFIDMLRKPPYPPGLKFRIKGPDGRSYMLMGTRVVAEYEQVDN